MFRRWISCNDDAKKLLLELTVLKFYGKFCNSNKEKWYRFRQKDYTRFCQFLGAALICKFFFGKSDTRRLSLLVTLRLERTCWANGTRTGCRSKANHFRGTINLLLSRHRRQVPEKLEVTINSKQRWNRGSLFGWHRSFCKLEAFE